MRELRTGVGQLTHGRELDRAREPNACRSPHAGFRSLNTYRGESAFSTWLTSVSPDSDVRRRGRLGFSFVRNGGKPAD